MSSRPKRPKTEIWNKIMNVIISQALATGLPVITTKHSGLPEQVEDGYNGFLVDEGNFQALADKILFLIENSDSWIKLGKNGRNLVTEKYNSEKLIIQQIEIYNSLIKK